ARSPAAPAPPRSARAPRGTTPAATRCAAAIATIRASRPAPRARRRGRPAPPRAPPAIRAPTATSSSSAPPAIRRTAAGARSRAGLGRLVFAPAGIGVIRGPVESRDEQGALTLRGVRIAALIVFVSVAVFSPIDVHYSSAGLRPVLFVYGVHATLGLAVLLAS